MFDSGSSNSQDILTQELLNGKVFLFNKPLYWTSFDLVNKVKSILKYQLKIKKIKVGHAGTLDPLATGLIIVCTGKETKNIESYQDQPKEYIAKLTLGATTPSYDLETEINARYPVDHIRKADLETILHEFQGTHMQMPPDFSARFVNGTRAYKLARMGETIALQPKEVSIHQISLISYTMPVIEIKVNCSKGTYIRSLARDIGIHLHSGAYLSGLVRTAIGNFFLKDALSIEEFERNFVFL
jgi:tRNA pseudouridine55 synthase